MALEWEMVVGDTHRLKVEGGWLYRYGNKMMAFVPASSRGQGHRPPGGDAFPSLHRKAPVSPDVVDAEFEKIPAGEVNGSEVITLTRRE